MKKNFVSALLAFPLVVFSTWSLKAQEVFTPYEGPDSAALLDEFGRESPLRQRLVRVNLDILQSAYANVSVAGASELTLNFFPDESFSVFVSGLDASFRPSFTLLKGRSTEGGDFTYIPQVIEEGYVFLFFNHPEEFTWYLVREVKDGVSLIFKFPWGSLFTPYRGSLFPDKSQTSGKPYRLVHINYKRMFSELANFSDGKEARISFDLFTGDLILNAYIESAIHTPVENSIGDYKITLDIPREIWATGDNTFDLNIVDGKVASMEITYNWATSRNRYEVFPFDKVEGVYIITKEVIEDFRNN